MRASTITRKSWLGAERAVRYSRWYHCAFFVAKNPSANLYSKSMDEAAHSWIGCKLAPNKMSM